MEPAEPSTQQPLHHHPLLHGLCDHGGGSLLPAILRSLTRRDAAALAAASKTTRATMQRVSYQDLTYQPQLYVAVSAASRLVEIPLTTAEEPTAAWCLRQPPAARRPRRSGPATRKRSSGPACWPTSLAFNPWDHLLHVW
jgi:hypothetical protein